MNRGDLHLEDIAVMVDGLKEKLGFHPYSLDLAKDLVDSLGIWVENLEHLSFPIVQEWHRKKDFCFDGDYHDREIHGFLKVAGGAAVIFINASDSYAQRRFTLAHELAHFLIEQKWVSEWIRGSLGGAIEDKWSRGSDLDTEDRLLGVLKGIPLKSQEHLLDSTGESVLKRERISLAEWHADLLAFELLAPMDRLLEEARSAGHEATTAKSHDLLVSKYLFPQQEAKVYARLIADKIYPNGAIRDWLGM